MNINQFIHNTLKDLNIMTFFIQKPDGFHEQDYLTFNYSIEEDWYSDNKAEIDTHYVTINVVTPDTQKVFDMAHGVRKALKDNDDAFAVVTEGSVYDNSLRSYVTVITFKVVLIEEQNIKE